MLDIGIQELLVIMILALLIFGPDKLPELGRRLGRAMREFRRASDEFRSTVEQNLQLHVDHDVSPTSSSSAAPGSAGAETAATPEVQARDGDGQGIGGPAFTPAAAGAVAVEGEAAD